MNREYYIIPLLILLCLSFITNYYYISNNDELKTNYENLLKEKDKEIEELKKLNTEKIQNDNSIPTNFNERNSENNELLNDNKTEIHNGNLIKDANEKRNAAERFIEYAFNVTPENFAQLKKNAHHYMSDKLVNTLFSSDGINEEKINMKTKVSDLQVFLNSKNDNSVIVRYTLEIEILNSDYKETNLIYTLLKLTSSNGKYKVEDMEQINDWGGV